MKFMVIASMPVEAGNHLAKQGKLGSVIQSALEVIKPDAVYFGAKDGKRTMFMVVDMHDASQIPGMFEPLFLALNASVDIFPVMQTQDLMKATPGIEAAVKKFGS